MTRPTNLVAASWLAKIKAQGGPVAQGGAIPRAEAEQAPAAEKTGLARALDAAIARGDASGALAVLRLGGAP